ncbi:hypothetical protein H6P81_019221 [Aristolochia fimbriata]|uniref:Uncharacterized protein n=1 Tax=Aristolochia fimbriata TaxID=158543 RepID=A0AAV7DS96_ARIFI|nr:hypothetical protein H6P81_019221 [Aristolochia fimbriata]
MSIRDSANSLIMSKWHGLDCVDKNNRPIHFMKKYLKADVKNSIPNPSLITGQCIVAGVIEDRGERVVPEGKAIREATVQRIHKAPVAASRSRRQAKDEGRLGRIEK